MGIFSSILDKLRGHGPSTSQQTAGRAGSAQQQGQPPAQQQSQQQQSQQQQAQPSVQGGLQGSPHAAIQSIDIEAVLSEMAAKKGGGGNYRESIVDLLKLLDLDSSLEARKALARELNVNAGAPGSVEQNIALHQAVMLKIEQNGGKVPDSMKH